MLGHQLSILGLLIKKNLQNYWARPAAFLVQIVMMFINNILYFSMWWIFFHRFQEIKGWGIMEIELLFGMVMGAFGLTMIFGAGLRSIGQKITSGEIEGMMTQPSGILLRLVTSESAPSGWGDLLSCLVLLIRSPYVGLEQIPLVIFLILCSAAIFSSMGIIIYSLAFWFGPMESLSFQLLEFVLSFSVYPQTAYVGLAKVMIFSLIPAGFIGFLPIEILRSFSWTQVGFLAAASLFYMVMAVTVFHGGLRRYRR